MDKVFGNLLECFSEFTWRRFLALTVICIIVFTSFSLFERYTSSFRLNRLQKTSELLVKMNEMEKNIENGSPEIKRASKELIKQTIEAIETKPMSLDYLPTTFTFSMDYLWKILAGSAFWLIFAITRIPKIIKGDVTARSTFSGMLFFATIAAIFANTIPTVWWPWGHVIIYPLFIMAIVLVIFVAPITFWSKKTEGNATHQENG